MNQQEFEDFDFEFEPIDNKFLIKAMAIGGIAILATLALIGFVLTLIF